MPGTCASGAACCQVLCNAHTTVARVCWQQCAGLVLPVVLYVCTAITCCSCQPFLQLFCELHCKRGLHLLIGDSPIFLQ